LTLDEKTDEVSLPHYKHGIYESVPHCVPANYEANCFPFVLNERRQFSVRERLQKLPNLPKSATLTDANMLSYITKLIAVPKSGVLPTINMSGICRYAPKFGFMLSVDSASNLSAHRGYTVAVSSLSKVPFILGVPLPAMSSPNDLVYTKDIDTSSKVIHPRWNDGFRWFRKHPFDANYVILIELFNVQLKGKERVLSKGWTVFTPFTSTGYVRHGSFQLPLFQGTPARKAVKYWQREDPENAFDDAVENEAVKLYANNPSVTIRVVDARRSEELPVNTVFRIYSANLS
jgi:hypothetical protein